MDVSIYLSRTGVLLQNFSVLRAGNNKIGNSIKICSKAIDGFFPFKGSIIGINNSKALINLGRLDDLNIGDRFLIARKGKVNYISESPWYEIADEDKLGIFTVEKVGEAVAEGVIEKPGFFELANRGDEIYIIPEDQEIILKPDYGYNQNLKRELLRLY